MGKVQTIAMIGLMGAVLAGCDSGHTRMSGDAPTPTVPTAGGAIVSLPTLEPCPISAWVCDAAAAAQAALRNNDIQPLLQRALFREYRCPDPRPQGLGGPYPLCDDTPGQVRYGFNSYNDAVGLVVERRELESGILSKIVDSSTRGFDWRVRTVACWADAAAPSERCTRALIVFGHEDASEALLSRTGVLMLDVTQQPVADFQLGSITSVFALNKDTAKALLDGGPLPADPGHISVYGFGPAFRWSVA